MSSRAACVGSMRQQRMERYHALAGADGPPAQLLIDSSAVRAHRCAAGGKGEYHQAIGRSCGGRTTKIHALNDGLWRPVAFMLTGGQVADCKAGEVLLGQMPETGLVNADKRYDSNAIRRQISERGAFADIPPKANRIWKNCFSPSSTATGTQSGACSAASRISAGSQRDTTASNLISSPQSASPQP